MGRHRKKAEDQKIHQDWPFEVSIDLSRFRPKIAFLSGCPREYYPEDPGFSRFGIANCLPDSEDTAKCNFVPSTDLLPKPISLLGYSIGGLLAARFPKLEGEGTPGPPDYQAEVTPRRVKEVIKSKRTKWNDFVAKYAQIVQDQVDAFDKALQDEEVAAKQKRKTTLMMQGPLTRGRNSVSKTFKPVVQKASPICIQKRVSFGMGLMSSRFGFQEANEIPGTGTYNVSTPAGHPSFQITTPQGKLIPRVRTVCDPENYDMCMSCAKELVESDYYQTREKLKVVNSDTSSDSKHKMVHLSLCRDCYCHALKNGIEPWAKDRVPSKFIKARHCNSIHDHKEGLKEFLTKSTCKQILHLARKELMFSRHFKDNPCLKGR